MPSRGRALAAALAFCEVGMHTSCGIRSCREHEGPVSRFPFDLDLGLLWSTVGDIRRAEWALQSFSVIFFFSILEKHKESCWFPLLRALASHSWKEGSCGGWHVRVAGQLGQAF